MHQNLLSLKNLTTWSLYCPLITTCLVRSFTTTRSLSNPTLAPSVSRNASLSTPTSPLIFRTSVNFKFPPRLKSEYTGSSFDSVLLTK